MSNDTLTTTPQAALLSDKEINARISGSEVHEYHPGAILELVRELEQDILSKLKPPPSMLTNDELIALAVEHGLGRTLQPLGLNTGNVFYTDNSYRTAALFDFADAHEAAILAKLKATQEPVQAGELPPLPFPNDHNGFGRCPDRYTADQMHAYARAALSARKPLNSAQIRGMAIQEQFLLVCDSLEDLTCIVREVERAHGISK